MKKPVVGFIAGVTAPPGKRMGHAGALISGGADTADAKLEVMEACGIRTTRNPPKWASCSSRCCKPLQSRVESPPRRAFRSFAA